MAYGAARVSLGSRGESILAKLLSSYLSTSECTLVKIPNEYYKGTILSMPKALSILTKQQLGKDSKNPLVWADLDSRDRKIIMSVTLTNSIENARKSMKLSIGGFYKRWQYLKPIYNNLLNDLPTQAVNILKLSSRQAAETLTKNLEAQNPSDQIKAANSILDRVTPERDQIQQGVKRELKITEFVNMSDEEIEKMRSI